MWSIHHPIFSQRNNLSTVEPHNGRSLKASARSGKGALKHPLKKADLACDVEGGNVPAVDLVAFSQPRIYPPANLLYTSVGKAVIFDDHACRVQVPEHFRPIAFFPAFNIHANHPFSSSI